jgi:PAS domain S-box-containing protein
MPTSPRNKQRRSKTISFSMLEALSTPVFVINTLTRKFSYCNSAFEDLSGFTLGEVKKLHWTDLFSEKDSVRARAIYDLLLDNLGQVAELDLSFRKKSGRMLAVNLFANSMPSSFSRHFLIISVHDLTHIKKLEKEKELAYREMSHVAKLADIGRLAAGIAHELNNPLMIIQGFTENIEAAIDDGSIEKKELKWLLNPILKASERMAKMISQLTRMSRHDEHLSLATVTLAEIVENVVRLTRNQLNYNEVELIKDYDRNIVVKCDPNQVEQIILNILNNAVHALQKMTGKKQLTFKIHAFGGMHALSIHNNGPHIPEGIKEKIMTPFFTTKEVGEGTGLGLSVSYGIMKAHGGDLTFSSKRGLGATFNLLFPAIENTTIISSPARAIGLVVDDEDFARDIIVNELKRYGFRLIEAVNGEEALKVLKSRSDIDFVFADAKMPTMDGISLVKNIRAENKSMLVFAVTGFTGIRSIEDDFTRAGVDGFLAKPLDHEKILACVKQILSRVAAHNKKRAA